MASLYVQTDQTVGWLKWTRCAADYKKQMLFNGQELNDDQTLGEAGLVDGSHVTVGRLMGGLNVSVYKNVPELPDQNDNYTKCTGPNVWTTASSINYDFDGGDGLVYGCPHDWTLVHYSGYLAFPTDRTVRLCDLADDGFRLDLDGVMVLYDWRTKGTSGFCSDTVTFTAGDAKKLDVWLSQGWGGVNVALYTQDAQTGAEAFIPSAYFNTSPYFNFDAAQTYRGLKDVEVRDFVMHDPKPKLTASQKAVLDGFVASHPSATKVEITGSESWLSAYGVSATALVRMKTVRNYLLTHGLSGAKIVILQSRAGGQPSRGNDDVVDVKAIG
jgi:hypothetical protein